MKYLIKFLAIIGLVSMAHVAVAIDNVSDGDILEAAGVNEVIDATNNNSDDIAEAKAFIREVENEDVLDEDCDPDECLAEGPVVVEPIDPPDEPACGEGIGLAVGDTGPGGGLVFVTSHDGCYGLEASESDLNDGAGTQWGCHGTEVGTIGQGYGDGRANTGAIIDAGCTDGIDDAADLAFNYAGGGETGWYLPAINEVEEMYHAIGPGADNAGGFDPTGHYWSSTEIYEGAPVDEFEVWVVNFETGHTPPTGNPKNFNYLVRAVRIFDVTPD